MIKIKFQFFVLLIPFFVFAGYDGGVTSPILSYNLGARGYGMGSAFTAIAEDTTAVFWNPAGLSRIYRQEVSLYYEQLFQDVSYFFGGYSYPIWNLGVASCSFMYMGTRFKAYDSDLSPIGNNGEMNAYLYVINLAFAQKMSFYQRFFYYFKYFDAGANIKLFGSGFTEVSRLGVGLDLGIRYYPHHFNSEKLEFLKNMVVGLKINNLIPPTIKYGKVRDWYMWDLNFGILYRTLYDTLNISLDFSQTLFRKRAIRPRIGVEYNIYKSFKIRAGYNNDITVGAGFELEDFSMDYAFGYNFDLGAVHHISVSYHFGEIVP